MGGGTAIHLLMTKVMVQTPKGIKHHGDIEGDSFVRRVTYKDLMRIFDAWSIHPDALNAIRGKVKRLKYIDINAGKIYVISLEDVKKYGFEKEFSGGKTIYIQRKYWKDLTKEEAPTIIKIKQPLTEREIYLQSQGLPF